MTVSKIGSGHASEICVDLIRNNHNEGLLVYLGNQERPFRRVKSRHRIRPTALLGT